MIYFGQDSRESGALKPQILSDYDLPKEVKAHESVVIKKLVSVEASKEETDNTIMGKKETNVLSDPSKAKEHDCSGTQKVTRSSVH